jgi:hypothetical protein
MAATLVSPPLKWSLTCSTRGGLSLWVVSDSALRGAPPGRFRNPPLHCHGQWRLCGHLQAPALHDNYVVGALASPGGGSLEWRDPACYCANSFFAHFPMLLVSYAFVLNSLKSHGSKGWRKVLSTCGFHFTAVVLFFVSCIFTYLWPVAT